MSDRTKEGARRTRYLIAYGQVPGSPQMYLGANPAKPVASPHSAVKFLSDRMAEAVLTKQRSAFRNFPELDRRLIDGASVRPVEAHPH